MFTYLFDMHLQACRDLTSYIHQAVYNFHKSGTLFFILQSCCFFCDIVFTFKLLTFTWQQTRNYIFDYLRPVTVCIYMYQLYWPSALGGSQCGKVIKAIPCTRRFPEECWSFLRGALSSPQTHPDRRGQIRPHLWARPGGTARDPSLRWCEGQKGDGAVGGRCFQERQIVSSWLPASLPQQWSELGFVIVVLYM